MKKPNRSRNSKPQRRDPVADLNRAIKACESGLLDEAENACRKALAANREWPEALHVMGVVQFRLGNQESAIQNLQRAIQFNSNYAPAFNDLGNILHESGRLKESIAAFRRYVELEPNQATGLNNLAVVLKDDNQFDEAVAALDSAIKLKPDYFSAWLNLGYTRLKKEEHLLATEAFERASGIQPDNTLPIRVLSQIYRQLGDDEETLLTYQRWLKIEPDCEIAKHMILAFTSEQSPIRAGDGFVRQEFDRFAESFDSKLEKLNYQAPEIVFQAIARHCGEPKGAMDLLDAGCGTGKGGLLLRPFANRMVGVDLSGGMLAHAKRTGVYDELVESELVRYLDEHPDSFDLITIIDTFIYFGDLEVPIVACAKTLRTGGGLAFTVETAMEETCLFHLERTGRYVHGKNYLNECMKRAGFTGIEIQTVTLREERGEPVQGFVVWGSLS